MRNYALHGILLTFVLAVTMSAVGGEDGGYDLARLLKPLTSRAPQTHPVQALDRNDIRALFYDGLPYQGSPTRVFAYLGIPTGADAKHKVPGMVLVHGGGGTAFHEWVRIWNERGYAAIAMDLEGHAPITNAAWAGPARVGVFDDANLSLTHQWPYHAVADIMLAHSLLAAQSGVDARRIGVTGISWGGVLTSIVAGVDLRFRFAVPVYGCGFLFDSAAYFGNAFHATNTAQFAQRLKWDPSNYLPAAHLPVLWINGDQDAHFSVDITSRSHQAMKGRSYLTLHPAMPHGHQPGWQLKQVPEIYAFADQVLKHGVALPTITRQPVGTNVVVRYAGPRPLTNAVVWFVTEPLSYKAPGYMVPDFTWHQINASLNPRTHTATATLPADARTYYVNLTDDRGLTVSANLTCVGRPDQKPSPGRQ